VNHKRAMRIMREQGFTVRPRRRFVVTTNSNHFGPIFPNLAKELTLKGVPVGNLIRLASEAESRNVSIL
jgi:hypothetical protein